MTWLIKVLFGILNWYENTTIRADDPAEITNLKVYERRVVASFILALILAGLSLVMTSLTPTKSDIVGMMIAPIFRFASTGFVYAALVAIASTLFYVGRSVIGFAAMRK